MRTDFTSVTEIPGLRASEEQLARLYNRYRFASEYCNHKDVLEVARGAGLGLGCLSKFAKEVVGGDIDENNLRFAKEYYQSKENIEIKLFDAHNFPFEDKSFDVVILYEAIYYLEHPEKFIDEARRVLRDNGILIICTVNKDWSDFNPSPYSIKYFSIPELYQFLNQKFADIKFFGAFETSIKTTKDKIISFIKRTAVSLHLIPRTMKGKEILKRIFFGKLKLIPPKLENGMTDYVPPLSIPPDSSTRDFKVLYTVAYASEKKR
ncbi:MAG: class I SAM-dependent methyltransferase [Thermodesulfovibrionales bacterium]|nr:class I SAM-dependent methyltransferase [Thermodesulfovibrionales bacterium]